MQYQPKMLVYSEVCCVQNVLFKPFCIVKTKNYSFMVQNKGRLINFITFFKFLKLIK